MSKYLKTAKTFDEYDSKCKKILRVAHTFIIKLKKRILEKKKKIRKFVQIIRYNKLLKNKPCNEMDLYTLEGYNKNNKNIYLIDIDLNKKWWFSIETITKLLCNNLSQFDIDTHNIICKTPVNPYINKFLNIGQLLSIYEQLKKYNNVNNLITLFRLAQFNISKFLFMYENDVIDYSYKYNIENIDNNGLLIILDNLLYVHNIYYVNVFKLSVDKTKRQSIISLLKNCLLSYKKNQLKKIRQFVLNNTIIIRRAKRPTNTLNNNTSNNNTTNNNNNMMDCDTEEYNSETEDYNSETEDYNSETEIENNEININNNSDEDNKYNDIDEDKSNNDLDEDTNSNDSDEDNNGNDSDEDNKSNNDSNEDNKSNNDDSDEDTNLNINDIDEDNKSTEDNKSNNDDSDEDNKSNNDDSDEDNKSNNESGIDDVNKEEFNIDEVIVNIEMDIELENTFNNLIIN
jgi:hypothetical protein